jgi:exodeoxyribonuclease VII large subunit
MTQLPLIEPQSWSITDLTRHLRNLLESDRYLQDLWVVGEVSNFSSPSSGHLYFTLKDAGSSIRCVMWRGAALRQTYLPRDGDEIEVHGSISIYEAAGQYQLYVDRIRPVGAGALFQAFLRLKDRLEEEGLFDPERKKPLPKWPKLIGIVSSPTGAALRDMLNTLSRRFPLVEVVLAPTAVQGADAPAGIVSALEKLNLEVKPDLILLARGGGSIEDLWAFNDEMVARAIADSNAPVITGVGHETDFTIADFVSDLRAPTPTAAAELATPDRVDLIANLIDHRERLQYAVVNVVNSCKWGLQNLKTDLAGLSPQSRIRNDRQRVDDYSRRTQSILSHTLKLKQTRVSGLQQRLVALNPTAILERGYALVQKMDGKLVRRVNQVATGESLTVHVRDGDFGVKVEPNLKGSA